MAQAFWNNESNDAKGVALVQAVQNALRNAAAAQGDDLDNVFVVSPLF